jgi:hypothetical protein
MIVCSKCAAYNEVAATFCVNCGAAIVAAPPFKFDGGAVFGGIFLGIIIPFGYVFVQMWIVGIGENTPCPHTYVSIAVSTVVVLALITGLVLALRRRRPGGQFVVALTVTALTILALPVAACSSGEIGSILTNRCANHGTPPIQRHANNHRTRDVDVPA